VASRLGTRIRTLMSLGLSNVGRVISYRVRLRAGVHPVQRIAMTEPPAGPFFRAPTFRVPLKAPTAWRDSVRYFGWKQVAVRHPPDWFYDPFLQCRRPGANTPWWKIPDFDADGADIKNIWELSRLDWVVQGAQRALAGDLAALETVNSWLTSWSVENPPYSGPNWKCGQEASIRVMHLALAAMLLQQTESPEPSLVEMVTQHLARIAPTIAYAIGQDNNHGTSEAAALVIAGSWLQKLGVAEGAQWYREGRTLLTERADRLIAADGSFSQYSVTYHRFMLDTLSLTQLWVRHLGLKPFDQRLLERAAAATAWLDALADPISGDAPNLGANDGVNLLPLTDADYRDFRPAIALATALFRPTARSANALHAETHVAWLGLPPASAVTAPPPRASQLLDDGGYAVIRRGSTAAILRYPRFRFRPGHADALHVDLWHGGENLLHDGGSFSYAAAVATQNSFVGALGHNGIQFDSREQMPRLGRFLWGDWLTTTALEPPLTHADSVEVAAAYRDRSGAHHGRRVTLADASLNVRDAVRGFHTRAVLRWRLRPGAWTLAGDTVTDGTHRLTVSATVPIVRRELISGWESRYYMQKTPISILEIEIAEPGELVSEYRFIA
jgi:Heparinase II/III-like protein/Heparinase II/III N-terminus